MVFGWLNIFKRKKKEDDDVFSQEVTPTLPDDLERFRVEREMPQRPMDLVGTTEKTIEDKDKMDLILQKLETIDVRLKLLEEKLGV